MRILFCAPDLDRGGSAKSLSILLERLAKRHEIHILAMCRYDESREMVRRYQELGIPIDIFTWGWLPVDMVGCRVDARNSRSLCQRLRPHVPEFRSYAAAFDAVCHNSYASASLAPLVPLNVPQFLVAREVLDETSPEFAGARHLLRRHMRRASAIGPVEAAQLCRLGIEHKIIFNSAPSTPRFAPLPDFSGLRFGVFAQLVPDKGLDTLLAACVAAQAALRRLNAGVHVFGSGAPGYERRLADSASAGGIGDIFRLEGWTGNVEEKMKAMHCVVRPDATGSPWGRDVIEAMSIGRPVLASGSERVFVHDGDTGVLVPPNDPGALARELIRLAENPEKITQMGRRAHAFASQNFDPDVNCPRLEEYFFGKH